VRRSLVVASGGSFGLALGVAGAGTYVAAHGRGVASLIRDPSGATRPYVDTTSPGMMALDGAELGMTFLPGGFGGATGRSAREAHDAARVGGRTVDDAARSRMRVTDDAGHAGDAARPLDAADLDAIAHYTGSGYWEMNQQLRARTVTPGSSMEQRVEALSTALGKLPKHEGPVSAAPS
jgi:hypothetical protein